VKEPGLPAAGVLLGSVKGPSIGGGSIGSGSFLIPYTSGGGGGETPGGAEAEVNEAGSGPAPGTGGKPGTVKVLLHCGHFMS
jgi:hypothetical protein